ncbi:hypothetical protein EON65_34455, partial [archaeon]
MEDDEEWGWYCPICSLQNAIARLDCDVCGYVRGNDEVEVGEVVEEIEEQVPSENQHEATQEEQVEDNSDYFKDDDEDSDE